MDPKLMTLFINLRDCREEVKKLHRRVDTMVRILERTNVEMETAYAAVEDAMVAIDIYDYEGKWSA